MANIVSKTRLYLEANNKVWKTEKESVVFRNDGGDDYIDIWNVSGLTKPTSSQLDNYNSAGDTYEVNEVVRETRKISYGPIGDQLDMIYWDQVNGTTTFKDHVVAVKASHPKGDN
jgi:hypothetical protein